MRLRTWLALLAVFVTGSVLWTLVGSWVLVRVGGLVGEGPFAISIDNRSGEAVVVTTRQVGATAGTRHPLPPDATSGADWRGCATTEVVVELRGVPDREVARERVEVCDGDTIVVGAGFDVLVADAT